MIFTPIGLQVKERINVCCIANLMAFSKLNMFNKHVFNEWTNVECISHIWYSSNPIRKGKTVANLFAVNVRQWLFFSCCLFIYLYWFETYEIVFDVDKNC